MNVIWDLLNDLSFIMVLSFISIGIPGLAQTIQKIFFELIYLDLLQTDKWLIPLIYEDTDAYEPLNPYFELNGFQSTSMISNLGSAFVSLLVFLFLHLLLLILKLTDPLCCPRYGITIFKINTDAKTSQCD